jgi:hypothetical protein
MLINVLKAVCPCDFAYESAYDSVYDFLHKVLSNLIFNPFFLRRIDKQL